MNIKVWHYTVGEHLPSIITTQEIRAATAFVAPGELPVVWFSTAARWEETANKLWRNSDGSIRCLSREETAQLSGGLFRIEVQPESAPFTWHDYLQRSNVSKKVAKGLKSKARAVQSDVSLWRISFEPVTADKWIGIERFDGGRWRDVVAPISGAALLGLPQEERR